MTLRAFRLAISGVILLGSASMLYSEGPMTHKCHSNYSAGSFEEANYDLVDFLNEYFANAKVPFLPTKKDADRLGLKQINNELFELNSARIRSASRSYPFKPGIWKIVDFGNGTTEVHLLIKEPQRLAQTQVFNSYNDLLGEPFADYDDSAYVMVMQPEDVRRRYDGHFFTINAYAYGLMDDATGLPNTVVDVVLTDYTNWVRENAECGKK